MPYDLLEKDLFHICDAASELKEISEVILFGSRAKGTYRQGPDVDSVYQGKMRDTLYRSSAIGRAE